MGEKYKGISSSYFFDTNQVGSTATIFGGIHGDESSGVSAIKRFLEELQSNQIFLLKGKLILVTEANEEAIKIGKREVKKNLNRLFLDENTSQECYEDTRAQELKSILRESDYLLDLHSTSGPSIPFAFAEKENFAFAKKLGISHVIGGWGELGSGVISGDTEMYINSHGGVGITFEAGNHENPQGAELAYQVLLNYLVVLGMIDEGYFQALSKEQVCIMMSDIYIAKADAFIYKIEPQNFQKLLKGTCIGVDGDEEIYAPYDMILGMPKKESIVQKGGEVFFIGKELG